MSVAFDPHVEIMGNVEANMSTGQLPATPGRPVPRRSPRNSPRVPLATVINRLPPTPMLTKTPNLERLLLTGGQGAACLSASAPRARPKPPSTPGGSVGDLDSLSATFDAELEDKVPSLPSRSRSLSASPAVSRRFAARYSEGGTAQGAYSRFSISQLGQQHVDVGTDAPTAHAPAVEASPVRTLEEETQVGCFEALPSTTRALVLEERLRESERRVQELRRANGLLRQQAERPARAAAATQTAPQRHPCFGELLADLGFKKIYRASARTLVNSVPIWSKQRACNEARVDQIVQAKVEEPSLMGPIMAFEFAGGIDGELALPSLTRPQPRAIFDGQHRARAAMRLLSSNTFTIEDDDPGSVVGGGGGELDAAAAETRRRARGTSERRLACVPPCSVVGPAADGAGKHADFDLIVEVYPVSHEHMINELYLEVNKCEVVKEIDLPDAIAPLKKGIIDEATERLRLAHASMFKASERCRPPHVHRDTLRNRLSHHPSVELMTSADELYHCLTAVNRQLASRPARYWPQRLAKSLEKATANGFYLGLNDYAWLDEL